MEKVFLRTAYNYDMNKAGDESALHCKDKTLAQQQFRDEVDINTIVERFGLTGELPDDLRLPQYGDYTGIFDFQSAMNTVRQATENFMQLPAKMRARFNNDPQQLLEFLDDDDNRPEAEKLGLVNKKPEAPAPVEPPTPAPKEGKPPSKDGTPKE